MFNYVQKLILGLAVTAAGTMARAGDNDLFSDVRAGSVFSTDTASPSADPTAVPLVARRITDTQQLIQLLQDAGFATKATEGRSVPTEKTLEPWRFPVTVVLSEDEQSLQIALALGAVPDRQKITSEKLLSLLEASKKHAPAQFVFNSERNRTELLGRIRNDSVTSEQLRDEINRLALVAKDTEALWQITVAPVQSMLDAATINQDVAVRVTAAQSPPATNVPSTPPAPQVPLAPATGNNFAVTPATLTGRWSASRGSNEAFAILFDANGGFVLVSIRSGQQSKSSGKFTLSGTQLTLVGTDGLQLTGSVDMKSATEFSFQPQTTGSAATSLSFKKSP